MLKHLLPVWKSIKNYTCRNVGIYYISFNLNISSVKHLKQLDTHNDTDIHGHHEICILKCCHRKVMHDTVLSFHIFSKFFLM